MFTYHAFIAIASLTLLEIILGIDNILFISIMVQKIPKHRRELIRKLGILMALVTRLLLLLGISLILAFDQPLFTLYLHTFSVKHVVLITGGFFLLYKAISEIHEQIEGSHIQHSFKPVKATGLILGQIMLLDIVFSVDSILTAIGMVPHVSWMAIAIVIAVMIMLFVAKPIGDFIETHSSIKLLALSFLVMVGMLLIADGFGHHFDRSYVYTAMIFAIIVELLNMRFRHKQMLIQ